MNKIYFKVYFKIFQKIIRIFKKNFKFYYVKTKNKNLLIFKIFCQNLKHI